MPSVTTDRHTLTIQMRKYSPALPVNLNETALPADCGAADEFATSLPLFLSSMADSERAASIDVRSLGLKEFGPAHIRIKFTDLRRGPPGLNGLAAGPYSSAVTAGRFGDGNGGDQGNPGLPGRGEAVAPPHDPLLVRQQGDLPEGADIERLRRRGQAALRGALRQRLVRPGCRPEDPRLLRQEGAHRRGVGQRGGHVARRGGAEHRHDRQVGYARVLRVADRRPGE